MEFLFAEYSIDSEQSLGQLISAMKWKKEDEAVALAGFQDEEKRIEMLGGENAFYSNFVLVFNVMRVIEFMIFRELLVWIIAVGWVYKINIAATSQQVLSKSLDGAIVISLCFLVWKQVPFQLYLAWVIISIIAIFLYSMVWNWMLDDALQILNAMNEKLYRIILYQLILDLFTVQQLIPPELSATGYAIFAFLFFIGLFWRAMKMISIDRKFKILRGAEEWFWKCFSWIFLLVVSRVCLFVLFMIMKSVFDVCVTTAVIKPFYRYTKS